FLVKQRKDQISRWFNPTWENCTHILDLLSLPFDEFVAKCLCIHDQDINLGGHDSIFFHSVLHCFDLLRADKSDDVTRIVSHVDLFPAVKSFVLAHDYFSPHDAIDILKLIIGDRRLEVLCFLTELLLISRNWFGVRPDGAFAVFLIAAGSPPQFPSDLDLSPAIAHIGRHPSWENWLEASDASIAYLVQCNISALSKRTGVYEFLQNCVDRDFRDQYRRLCKTSEETREAAQTLLDQHQALFNSLTPPSSQEASINDAEDTPVSFDQGPSFDIPDSDSDQSHNLANVASSSAPKDPAELEVPPIDPTTTLAANSPLPSEDHELIDMSMPSEPDT
ncbi:hypothetical protein SISSUDRAFT_1068045, partial [Sistotremastrum suecicum HHB10207 ss-3]